MPKSAIDFTKFIPEYRLLFLCARIELTTYQEDQLIAYSAAIVDWPAFLVRVQRASLGPLAYHHLFPLCKDFIPAEVLEILRQTHLKSSENNYYRQGILLHLIEVLEENEVAVLAFKGPTIINQVYHQPGLRPFHDLDLLINQVDITKAVTVLRNEGILPKIKRKNSQLVSQSFVQELFRPKDGIQVDLHWALTRPLMAKNITQQDLWERKKKVEVAEESIDTLSREDLIVFLCIHGARNFWHKLVWIVDLSELMRTSDTLNWKEVWSRAKLLKSERLLRAGLLLAHKLLGAPWPAEIPVVKDGALHRMVDQVLTWTIDERGTPVGWRKFRYQMQIRESRPIWGEGEHRKLAWLMIKPSYRDRDYFPLPEKLHFLYFFIRPIRIVSELFKKKPRFLG